MKIRNIFLSILSLAALAVIPTACEEEDGPSGAPSIELSEGTIEFEKAGETKTVKVTATRDWKVDVPSTIDWISVDPKSGKGNGKATDVKITVLANDGMDREASIVFTIGFEDKALTVKQAGTGSPEDNCMKISEVRAKGNGSVLGDNSVICGTVISNAGLNNLTSKKIVILQDETGGIELYLTESSTLNRGDKVLVDLSGITLSEYAGLLQVTDFSSEKITLISSDNEIVAKKVTMTDFLANKYESQYVEISNVQVADADLSKTWVQNDSHSSITIVDNEGHSFVVRSSKYSSFGAENVPGGSGTIKGIAAIFNSTIQLIFSDADDYAGLTGERFSGGGSGGELPGGLGEGTEASPYNVAKALNIINSGSIPTDKVYVKGKISKLGEYGGEQYGNYTYFISDDGSASNELEVFRGYYLNGDRFTSADQIKVGDEVVVLGQLVMYNTTPEITTGSSIVSINGGGGSTGGNEPVAMSISDFIGASSNTQAILTGTVVATYSKGFIFTDGADYLLAYDGNTCPAKEGDYVKITGLRATYSGLPQIAKLSTDTSLAVEVKSSGNSFTLPAAKALAGSEVDGYTNTKTELVSFEGTLVQSGNYYNINIPGATKQGGVQYPTDALNISSFLDKSVKVTGFVSAIQSKYLNLMAVSIEESNSPYLAVSEIAISADASATSATFEITSNVDWTVASDNADYTVSPASGNGNATVTVSFPANTGDAKTVTLTVSTTADVATKSYNVVLTHRSVSSANSITWSGAADWKIDSDAKTMSLTSGSYTIFAKKNDGSTAPTVNGQYYDARVYAKGSVTISTTGSPMTRIVFNISTQGLKRLAPITADTGTIATQSVGDKTVTWTGSATSVTFTVGDKADYGSDGSGKAGQLDFNSIDIE